MKTLKITALTSALVLALQPAAFAETVFTPRAEINQTFYELSDNDSGDLYDTDYTMAGIGATFVVDNKWVFDLDFKGTIIAAEESDTAFTTGQELTRTEFSATVGYVFPALVLFAGYKFGETEEKISISSDNVTTTFDTDGIFLGASKTFPLTQNTSLAISGAYALLETELTISDSSSSVASESDGDGFSFAVTYNFPISTYQSYVKVDAQTYTYDDFEGANGYEIDETFSRITFGVKF